MRIVVARYKEDVSWCNAYPCIIYNKGDPLDGSIPLPNIGREAHTYLYHIVNAYDTLDDYTLFVQGNPFDHCPDFHERLQSMTESPDFAFFTNQILMTSSHECPYDYTLQMAEFSTTLFGDMPARSFRFGAGAQFVVSRRVLQSIPKYVYEYLLDRIDAHRGAWVIERFWEQLFLAGIGDPSVPPLRLVKDADRVPRSQYNWTS